LFFGIILLAILTRALIRDDTFRKFGKFKMYNRPFRDATMTDQPNPAPETIDIGGILKLLPHRYPLLLIDRVIEIVRAKRIVAIKNVTINEQFFVGHFPGYPIMPGVLIVEAMAQAGAALLFTEVSDRDDKLLVFTGIERARFRRPVTPGDQLRIEVDVLAFRGTAGRLQGKAYVDGKLACEAVVTCRLLQRPKAQATEAVSATETPDAS
jgi:3-hydroxyacyl-[acyl-carrier-protein] dehydratase